MKKKEAESKAAAAGKADKKEQASREVLEVGRWVCARLDAMVVYLCVCIYLSLFFF